MAHTINNNPSSTGDSSSSEPEYIKMAEHIFIDVPVTEDLNFCDCSIYKVPCNLRKVNKEAYTPMFISIGPIHFDKEELKPMHELKLRYLKIFWNRKRISAEQAMDKYKQYSKYLDVEEKKIRRCYAENFPEISKNEFIKMMLLDATFIMELLLRNCEWKSQSHKHEQDLVVTESFQGRHNDDPILKQPWLSRSIARDLMLLENQIPFSVLEKLYDDVVVPNGDKEKDTKFVDLATEYFLFYDTQMSDESKEHYRCVSSRTSKEHCNSNGGSSTEQFIVDPISSNSQETRKPKNKNSPESPKHFTDLIRFLYIYKKRDSNPVGDSDRRRVCHSDGLLLRTATQLRDSGVSFEKSDDEKPLLDVTFDKTRILSLFLCFGCFPCMKPFKARLRIPQLKVDHTTECIFRNLIAFEQCHYPGTPYICNYVSLIDSLIHTKDDVDMLVEKEVIVHELGSHKEVATLVNGLCKHVVTNTTCYSKTIKNLNDHYSKQWNHTVAALRFVYFRDLWRASSTVVGIVVLVFAVFQFLRAVPVVLYHV